MAIAFPTNFNCKFHLSKDMGLFSCSVVTLAEKEGTLVCREPSKKKIKARREY